MIATLLSRELDKLEVEHSEEELMLHSAIGFGMGPRLSRTEERRTKIINWYTKIFESKVLRDQFTQSSLNNYKKLFLSKFADIS